MTHFQFTPTDGLLNPVTYPTVPASETAARQQFMDLFNQLRDYSNLKDDEIGNLSKNQYNVLSYGAKGDGTTDDTASFIAAASAANAGNGVLIVPRPSSFYKLTGKITIQCSVIGQNSELRMFNSVGDGTRTILDVSGYTGDGIVITGLILDGQYDSGTISEFDHNIYVHNSNNVHISKNTLKNPYGDNVIIMGDSVPCDNIHVLNNVMSNPRRCNVSVVSATNVFVDENKINKTTTYVAAIDIEPNNDSSQYVDTVHIRNNVFNYLTGANIKIYHWVANMVCVQNIFIEENTFNTNDFAFVYSSTISAGDTKNVVLKENIFKGTGRAISVSRKLLDLEISNNKDFMTNTSGWYLKNLVSGVFNSNLIDATGRAIGMVFEDCSGISVTGNELFNINNVFGAIAFQFSVDKNGLVVTANKIYGSGYGIVISRLNTATPTVSKSVFTNNFIDAATRTFYVDANVKLLDVRFENNAYPGAGTFVGVATFSDGVTPREAQNKNPIGYGTAAPITGTWKQGDYVMNVAPTEQGTAGSKYIIRGWSCVVAGTPGTWVQDRGLTGN